MYRLYWRIKKNGKWTWKPVRHVPGEPGRFGTFWSTGVRTFQIFVEEPE